MSDPNWFQKKWGTPEVPTDILFRKIEELEGKYSALLLDVKRLEEENIENTNLIYQLMNSLEAVDARIDIVAENPWKEQFE